MPCHLRQSRRPTGEENYLPEPQADPHILVTSRIDQPGFTPIPLDPLNEALSIELLSQEAGRKPEGETEESAAREIARSLGGLPLALELAGAYLQYRHISFQQYLDLLRQNLKAATAIKFTGGGFTRHETDLYSTLKINEEVFEEEPRLRDILDLLTWSGTAPMGLSLMCQLLGVETSVELTSALGLGTLLRMLQKTPDAESYTIHRLLSQVRREEIPLGERQAWVSDVCQRAGDWFQPRAKDFTDLAYFEAEIDHLNAWLEHAERYAPRHASRLTWLQNSPPRHRGRYGEARALIDRAMQSFEQNQSSDEELQANLLNDLGFCYHGLLDNANALSCTEKALTIRLSILGEWHEATARSLNNIGASYIALGDPERAMEYDQRALAVRHKVLGERHHDTGLSYNNISVSYMNRKNYELALEYGEKALNIWSELYGQQHPNVALALNNIGATHSHMGNAKRAREYYEKALNIFRGLLGDQHPHTIKCAVDTAISLGNLGRPRQGLQLLEEILSKVSVDNPRYNWLRREHLKVRNRVPGLRQTTAPGQKKRKKKRG